MRPGRDLAAALLTACLAGVTMAGETAHGARPRAPETLSPPHAYFTDVELINQDGHPMRLYTDLLQGKTVVIDTIYTTCTGICPVMSQTLSLIQDHLGARVGQDVRLISISVDPEHDTPEKLKAFGEHLGAGPGWVFLTGSKENVEFALQKLGQHVENKTDHKAILLVGNERTGLWKKAFGLAPPQDILDIVDSVVDDKGGGSGTAPGG